MSVQIIGLNPAMDVEWRVEQVHPSEKTIIESSREWAGGKPPNVARWLQYLGGEPRLLMPLGGDVGRRLGREVKSWGVRLKAVPIGQETRTNVMVTPTSGCQLRFNPKGPLLSPAEWRDIFDLASKGFRATALTVISGSLPRAAPSGTYARLLREGRRHGAQVLLDCDGPAFAAGVKARPFLVKPNRFELALWAGRELKGIKALRAAARGLSTATGGWVLASMDAGGAMLVNTGEAFHLEARAPSVAARNEVGAGDALLARVAYEVERGAPPTEWLRTGVGTGTAFVQMPAGRLPGKAMIRRMIGEVELNRP